MVCGPSGSGKSTLMRTVNRLEEIDSGSIAFDGSEETGRLGCADINRLRSRIGCGVRSFNLFPHFSTLENGVGLMKVETALLAKVNETLPAMDEAGEIDAAWNRWLGPDTRYRMTRTDRAVPLSELTFEPIP